MIYQVRKMFSKGYDIYIDGKIVKYPLFYRGMRIAPSIKPNGEINFILPLKSISLLPDELYNSFQFKCSEFTASVGHVIKCQWGSEADWANVKLQALYMVMFQNKL